MDALDQSVAGLHRERGVLRERLGGQRGWEVREGGRNHCVLCRWWLLVKLLLNLLLLARAWAPALTS